MERTDLQTNLGRHIYDYSEIQKSDIPIEILNDLASSYMTRQSITYYHKLVLEDVVLYVALSEPSIQLFNLWRDSFMSHGYAPPVLNLVNPLS